MEESPSPEEIAHILQLLQKTKEETTQKIKDAEKKKVHTDKDMETEETTT